MPRKKEPEKPKPPDTKPQAFRTIKTSLKSILKDAATVQPIINKLVIKCNNIVTETYQFIRLFCLKRYHDKKPIPILDEKFILYCIKTLGTRDARGKKAANKDLEAELQAFYDTEFKSLLSHADKFDIKHMSYVFPYLAEQIHTGLHNNIKIHFYTRLMRFVNITAQDYETGLSKEEAKTTRNVLKRSINEDAAPPERYFEWHNKYREKMLPKTWDKCIAYDVKAHPEKYVACSFYMNEVLEKRGDCKLFQPMSLRSNIVPAYITLDTACLIDLFNMEHKGELLKAIVEHQGAVWDTYFKMGSKIFHSPSYNFNYTMQTDGIAVSLLFVHKKHIKNSKKSPCSTEQANSDYKYIDEMTTEELENLKDKTIVGGDPGKYSLIYLTDGTNKLRYNAFQRHTETLAHRNKRILQTEKSKAGVVVIETTLSEQNSKTVDYIKFKEYIKAKNAVNAKLSDFYTRDLFRKMKWRQFVYTQKSESRFLNNIEKTFGSPKDVVIAYGDWSRSSQMKHFMPTPGIGLRKVIAKRFQTVSVDEFRTSKLCCKCHKELEHYRNEENKKVFRCLICSECGSSESKISRFVTRDLNSALNISMLAKAWISEQKRPEAFCKRKVEGQALTTAIVVDNSVPIS